MKPCCEAFVYAYKWLYSWNNSKPEDLEDHLDKIPVYDTEGKQLMNHLNLNRWERKKIQKMKGNIDVLKEFSISLLYKVSLIACFNHFYRLGSIEFGIFQSVFHSLWHCGPIFRTLQKF